MATVQPPCRFFRPVLLFLHIVMGESKAPLMRQEETPAQESLPSGGEHTTTSTLLQAVLPSNPRATLMNYSSGVDASGFSKAVTYVPHVDISHERQWQSRSPFSFVSSNNTMSRGHVFTLVSIVAFFGLLYVASALIDGCRQQRSTEAAADRLLSRRGGKSAGKKTCEGRLAQVKIQVKGMTCGHCSGTVERGLRSMDGVQDANVDLLRGQALVIFTVGKLTAKAVAKEVDDLGFEAAVQEETYLENFAAAGTGGSSQQNLCAAKLSVKGMTCASCSSAVETGLRACAGIRSVEVDLLREEASVEVDVSKISLEQLVAKVTDLGFEAILLWQERVCEHGEQPTSEAPETATLHLAVAQGAAARGVLEAQHGVTSVGLEEGVLTVSYRPDLVGARSLLHRLANSGLEAEFRASGIEAKGDADFAQLAQDLMIALPCTIVMLSMMHVDHAAGVQGPLSVEVLHGISRKTLLLFAMSILVLSTAGRRFFSGAASALKRGDANMDVLVALAAGLSFAFAVCMTGFGMLAAKKGGKVAEPPMDLFETPCTLITTLLVGRMLESRAKQQTGKFLDDLLSSTPPKARVVQEEIASATTKEMPKELVELGDILEVRPGETVPVDGILIRAVDEQVTLLAFNEALLTGESRPIPKSEGDSIICGSSLVTRTPCWIRAERIGTGTALAKLVSLVEKAGSSANQAPVQRLADRIARVFVPFVIGLAVLTTFCQLCSVRMYGAAVDPQMEHVTGLEHCEMFVFAIRFGLSVLLVACPCALGLATPTAVMVATGVAAERGIVVKSASSFEQAALQGSVVLDKTGTLTRGSPQTGAMALCPGDAQQKLREVVGGVVCGMVGTSSVIYTDMSEEPINTRWLHRLGSGIVESGSGTTTEQPSKAAVESSALLFAASAARSEHPLSRGIEDGMRRLVGDARLSALLGALPPITEVEALVGHGVSFKLGNTLVKVGSAAWVVPDLLLRPDLLPWVEEQCSKASTVVGLSVDSSPVGFVALRDELRPSAKAIVDEFRRLGDDVWMCTGDRQHTALAIAADVGVPNDRVVADARPEDKASLVRRLRDRGDHVVVVGDGVNDAPALALANLGIAIGAGVRLTVDAADVILVKNDLEDVYKFKQLALATSCTIKRNFLWAFIFNATMLPVAAGLFAQFGVSLSPTWASAAMACSSIAVVLSSLQLRWFAAAPLPGTMDCA